MRCSALLPCAACAASQCSPPRSVWFRYWTSFIAYRLPGAVEPGNLLPEMLRPDTRYLTPDERDFFAVYKKEGRGH